MISAYDVSTVYLLRSLQREVKSEEEAKQLLQNFGGWTAKPAEAVPATYAAPVAAWTFKL